MKKKINSTPTPSKKWESLIVAAYKLNRDSARQKNAEANRLSHDNIEMKKAQFVAAGGDPEKYGEYSQKVEVAANAGLEPKDLDLSRFFSTPTPVTPTSTPVTPTPILSAIPKISRTKSQNSPPHQVEWHGVPQKD